jgi:cytosine/adenosine deaminase-related metal-dependent hydrolase
MMVWTHAAIFPATPAEVIAAGPDTVSHSCYLAYQLSSPGPQSYQQRFPVNYAAFAHGDNPAMTRLFREMRRRAIILDATLNVYASADRRAALPGGHPYHCTLDLAARLTDQARREGVAISAGTDGDTSADAPYPALFDELELLVHRAGLSPAEAIRSATAVGAATMGQARAMGSIAPGRLADLVVLARDPIADIANLRSVVLTVKRGRVFERRDYRPITREEAPDDD